MVHPPAKQAGKRSSKRGRDGTGSRGAWSAALGGFPGGLSLAAEVAIRDVLRVKKGERVVIVTNPDADVFAISAALDDAAAARGADTCVVVQPRRTSLDMASDAIIHAMRSEPDVVISMSAAKLGKDRLGLQKPYRFKGVKGRWSHIFNALTGARKARAFWSPAVTLDSFIRTVPVDYVVMRRRARKLARLLDGADRVHVTAPGGTDIEVGLRGRKARLDDGSFWKPGSGGNLPAGEAFISPANYDAEGLLVFDGSLSVADGGDAFVPRRPVTAEIRKGRAVRIGGGKGGERFEQSLRLGEQAAREMRKKGWNAAQVATYVRNARHLGELGIGLNPAAKVTGNMLEDEKILGTCHFAIGGNYDEDAEAFIHLDCIVKSPTITVIGKAGRRKVIMRGGKVL